MTITQKILAAHSDSSKVKSGDIISINIDVILGNDISAFLAIKELEKIGKPKIQAANKIILVLDHFTPNKDVTTAEQCRILREFAQEVGINYFFEGGRAGIEHALLPEEGLVVPGDLVIGGDSHTCTYGALGAFAMGIGSTDLAAAMVLGKTWLKVPETILIEYKGNLGEWIGGKDLILYTIGKIGTDGALGKTIEFRGPVIQSLDVENRLTMTNMAIEAGAVNGIIEPDNVTRDFLINRARREGIYYKSDADAIYENKLEINVSSISPQVALPFSPGNVASVKEVEGTKIDQVFIGSCTNGRIGDLRVVAKILKGRRAHSGTRLLISPATPKIYRQALEEGLLKIFSEAEAVILPPSCGVCFGGHLGILAKGEVCLSTTNRNFLARMGHPDSKVYLTSPAVAAASAIRGQITHPSSII
jgi:3-isopropylmalate/(R)-2-methylmalate dehydratase large subunit